MPFTIFYAWQMDREPKLNRWFIEEAIKDAIKQLRAESAREAADLKLDPAPAVDDRERRTDPDAEPADNEIIIEWGAAGGSGAGLIAETILERVTKCGAFVADLTFVTDVTTADERKKLMPNANVLIETGAAACTGQRWDRMVFVLNTAFGFVDQLPFDLKHRNCRIRYSLADPKDPEKANKRNQLGKELADQIRPIYESAKSRQIDAQKQTAANAVSEGRARAQSERDDFEQLLRDNKFHDFKAQFCILALTLMPVTPPKMPLTFNMNEDLVLLNYVQPFGSVGRPFRHRPKSVTAGNFDGQMPSSVVELTETGTVFVCYNLMYGRDGVRPNLLGGRNADPSQRYLLPMDVYQPQLIEGVQRLLKGLIEFGINGPWFLSLSLMRAANCHIVLDRSWHSTTVGKPCDLDDIQTETVVLPVDLNVGDQEAVAMALRLPLRQLWRACDHRTFPRYRSTGNVVWISDSN